MANHKSLIDADGEVRELTAKDLARFKPANEVLPLSLMKKLKVRGAQRRRPKSPSRSSFRKR